MHEHIIKWLSDIIKKKEKEECHICQFLGVVSIIQKFIAMSQKDGSWQGIKADILGITYYIFSQLIPKSVLVFFIFAPTSFNDSMEI